MISELLAILLVPLSSAYRVKGLALLRYVEPKETRKKVSMSIFFCNQMRFYIKNKIKLIYALTPLFLALEAISLVVNPSAKKI